MRGDGKIFQGANPKPIFGSYALFPVNANAGNDFRQGFYHHVFPLAPGKFGVAWQLANTFQNTTSRGTINSSNLDITTSILNDYGDDSMGGRPLSASLEVADASKPRSLVVFTAKDQLSGYYEYWISVRAEEPSDDFSSEQRNLGDTELPAFLLADMKSLGARGAYYRWVTASGDYLHAAQTENVNTLYNDIDWDAQYGDPYDYDPDSFDSQGLALAPLDSSRVLVVYAATDASSFYQGVFARVVTINDDLTISLGYRFTIDDDYMVSQYSLSGDTVGRDAAVAIFDDRMVSIQVAGDKVLGFKEGPLGDYLGQFKQFTGLPCNRFIVNSVYHTNIGTVTPDGPRIVAHVSHYPDYAPDGAGWTPGYVVSAGRYFDAGDEYYKNRVRAASLDTVVSSPVGLATEAGAADASVDVVLGGVGSPCEGLKAGCVYYAENDGTLTDDPTAVRIGTAVSATEILVRVD